MPTQEELNTQLEISRQAAAIQRETEEGRVESQKNLIKESAKLEFMRIAHVTLIENKRSLPLSERTITPEEIVEFANALRNSVYPE